MTSENEDEVKYKIARGTKIMHRGGVEDAAISADKPLDILYKDDFVCVFRRPNTRGTACCKLTDLIKIEAKSMTLEEICAALGENITIKE